VDDLKYLETVNKEQQLIILSMVTNNLAKKYSLGWPFNEARLKMDCLKFSEMLYEHQRRQQAQTQSMEHC